jgi:hypothetical protein
LITSVEERLEKWLTRSVVLSLIPIGLNALFTIARGKLPWPPSMLIGNGELLLLAVGIAATAIYDLSTKNLREGRERWGSRLSTAALVNIVSASSYYAFVVQGNYGGVVVVSLVLYISSLVCGILCVGFTVEGEGSDVGRS